MANKRKVCKIVSIISGLVLIVVGASFKWAAFPSIVDSMVASNLELTEENTETWEAWVEPPIPVFMKFTFFNITNTEKMKAGLEKPNVAEIGPFTYREHRRKENIRSVDDTISFGSYIGYEFDEDESCDTCKLDTEITLINPVMVIVAKVLKNLHDSLPEVIHIPDITIPAGILGEDPVTIQGFDIETDQIFNAIFLALEDKVNCVDDTHEEWCDDLFLTTTPDKLLYSGIESGVLKALYAFLVEDITLILQLAGIGAEHGEEILQMLLDSLGLPPMINLKDGIFGFYLGNNGTTGKTWWKINNGKYDLGRYNMVEEFNGMSSLPESWWNNFGPTPSAHKAGVPGVCHNIEGTDGMGFGPPIQKDSDVWIINEQICRSLWLSYTHEVDVDGVTAYHFEPPPEVFSMSNPNNLCYCPDAPNCAKETEGKDEWDLTECRNITGKYRCIDGLISLQGCQGAPAYISTPHFLSADSRLSEAIDGINPDPAQHVTFLNIEPLTGLPIQAHKRIQVNVPLDRVDYFTSFHNVQEAMFPIFWGDEGADIDEENLKRLKKLLVTPILVVDVVSYMAIAIGGVLFILGSAFLFFCRSNSSYST